MCECIELISKGGNVYYKCIECNHRFTGNNQTVKCPKCGSEDIKEQVQNHSTTNWSYINNCFK